MNKKLGRLADPTMGLYFGVLAAFAVASFLLDQPILAAAEAGAGGLLFLFYRLRKNHRSKELAAYIQSTTNTLESASKGEMPLPMALIRLVDGEIVWSNQRFNQVSGMKQTLFEQKVSAVLPSFTTDWLAAGKTECPYDLTLRQRRYRVYGSTFHAGGAGSTLLGTIYLADLTELYQVRDEYIRSGRWCPLSWWITTMSSPKT